MTNNTLHADLSPADRLAVIYAGHFARRRPEAPLNPYQFYIENREACMPVVPMAEPREPQQCMTNSFHVVTELMAHGHKVFFVEGYLLVSGCPITPHCWVEVQSGDSSSFIEPTMLKIEDDLSFFGVRIPNEVLVKCCEHHAWTRSVGCIEVMSHFSDADLAWAKPLMEDVQHA